MFDLSNFSITAVEDGVPTDLSSGLAKGADFFNAEREEKDNTTIRKGTRDTAYIISDTSSDVYLVDLTYLPNSPNVKTLAGFRKNKTVFDLFIQNNSEPKYTFNGKDCIVVDEGKDSVSAKDGFKDYVYKIKCSKGVREFQ